MDVTKPYNFEGFGAMDVTEPYERTGFGAMGATEPFEFIGFQAADVTESYEFIRFGAPDVLWILFLRSTFSVCFWEGRAVLVFKICDFRPRISNIRSTRLLRSCRWARTQTNHKVWDHGCHQNI